MTTVHDFIKALHNLIEAHFPDTERYIVSGGDYIKDTVMELREGNKRLRYSPYELFSKSENYEDTIEEFIKKWRDVCEKE